MVAGGSWELGRSWGGVGGGKGKISTIEGLGWGDVGNSSRGGANAEENPREMMEPVSRRRTSPESIFEAAMEMFN